MSKIKSHLITIGIMLGLITFLAILTIPGGLLYLGLPMLIIVFYIGLNKEVNKIITDQDE